MTELDALGFQVHMHAIGDRAVRNALDAVQAARTANGRTDNRHHIAHLQVVQPEDLPRFGALGVIGELPGVLGADRAADGRADAAVPRRRSAAGCSTRSATCSAPGARLAMGSDWAVTTANPLEQLEVAVHPGRPGAPRQRRRSCPSRRLPLRDRAGRVHRRARPTSTTTTTAGTLAVGRRADLAVLDRNVFAAPTRQIADARVVATIASGRMVYDDGTV